MTQTQIDFPGMEQVSKTSESLFAWDTECKARSILEKHSSDKWIVSYSGGSDSDTLMHFLRSIGYEPKGVFFNTGFEYQATKRHVAWMRSQGFDIEEVKSYKTIPVAIRDHGQPFWSKYVSDMLHRLMRNGFQFEDESFEKLYKRYPRCKAALRWWCNLWGAKLRNISWNPDLKEFLIAHPPQFKIHSACCDYAKKYTSRRYCKEHGIEVVLTGVRKAEGGIRASALKSCFLPKGGHNDFDIYMPLFWWSNNEKDAWDTEHGVKHSDCYSVYGLERTGCAACAFGKDFEYELGVLERYEQPLFKAANNLFGESYEYMRQFTEFRAARRAQIFN